MSDSTDRTNDRKPEALLTVRETGQLLRVSRQTLFRLSRRGELKPVRVGGCRRYRPSDVCRFVRRQAK